MRVIGLDQLPLPSLKAYAGLSAVLLAWSVFYAADTTMKAEDWQANLTAEPWHMATHIRDYVETSWLLRDAGRAKQVLLFMVTDIRCIWTLINMAYCCLILFGHLIQQLVFGELRVSEAQQLKEKFWNFVFYKFIFMFGVVNVQRLDEVVLWCSWFSVIGFLLLLAQLCKDRFEYLSLSPNTPRRVHVRLLCLLSFNVVCTQALLVVCFLLYRYMETNTFAFMAAECVLVLVTSVHVLMRYALYLMADSKHWWRRRRRSGSKSSHCRSPVASEEQRAAMVYWAELGFELLILSVDLVHHLHMVVWTQMILSMASLIIFMQLRYLVNELQQVFCRHRNHCRVQTLVHKFDVVLEHQEKQMPRDHFEESKGGGKMPPINHCKFECEQEKCAVCWEPLDTGRVLPCGHPFHTCCLLSWLVQDASCPTCRQDLWHRLQTMEDNKNQ